MQRGSGGNIFAELRIVGVNASDPLDVPSIGLGRTHRRRL
jgi:hypothetical protein